MHYAMADNRLSEAYALVFTATFTTTTVFGNYIVLGPKAILNFVKAKILENSSSERYLALK